MNVKISENVIKVDAANKSIGRLASEVARILNNKTLFSLKAKNFNKFIVEISNIKKIKISDKKLQNKVIHNTGYPGGIREKSWQNLYDKGPGDLLMNVIYNMIPENPSRKSKLKRIKFI